MSVHIQDYPREIYPFELEMILNGLAEFVQLNRIEISERKEDIGFLKTFVPNNVTLHGIDDIQVEDGTLKEMTAIMV